ncbi:E3 ubiquitin-protein ligase TRIM56-like [Ptychodera flava]|uniref:E3 ubiquitin-protein ligase TRIM56-like n=1 Tax=Ptychodera flava TaxID=63121 RepID=UPI00396A6896
MATPTLATPEEILDEIGEDFLTCPICLEQYQNPKVLPCHHSFCRLCLEKLVSKTGTLNCPTCQKSVQLLSDGVTGLDNNSFLNSMLEVVNKRTGEVSDQSERNCEFCEETEASVFCVDCEQYYCDVCIEKIHKKLKLASEHKVFTVEEYKKGKGKRQIIKVTENCKIHPKNEMKYYCYTCKIPICSDVPSLIIVFLTIVIDIFKKWQMNATRSCQCWLKVEIESKRSGSKQRKVKDACKKVTEQCLVNKQKVKKQKDALIDMIEKEERKLIEKLDTNCNLQVKGLESDISDLELKYENLIGTCSYTEALMHHGNAAQLVSKSASVIEKW